MRILEALVGWPATFGVSGNLIAAVICGAPALWHLLRTLNRHHADQTEQRNRQHGALIAVTQQQHAEQMALAEKHHQAQLDRIDAHAEAIKAHVTVAAKPRSRAGTKL